MIVEITCHDTDGAGMILDDIRIAPAFKGSVVDLYISAGLINNGRTFVLLYEM